MFFRIDELSSREVFPGAVMRSVAGEGSMATFFSFEPGSVVPEHRHSHQQISIVIKGSVVFRLGEEKRALEAGVGVVIPANTPHAVVIGIEPTEIWDLWVPVREDYLNPDSRSGSNKEDSPCGE